MLLRILQSNRQLIIRGRAVWGVGPGRLDTGILGSYPVQGMSSVSRGLATG